MKQINSKYYNMMKNDIMSFAYLGKVNSDMITSSINMLEHYLLNSEPLKLCTRRLLFLVVELFQNILRYGNLKYKQAFEYENSMMLVRYNYSGFYVGSVNIIQNDKIKYVRDKIQNINSSSLAELTCVYKKVLTNQTFTEKGGAGLGLIEMARKTKQKIECGFVKINDKLSYIHVIIRSIDSLENLSKNQDLFDLEWSKNFHYEAINSGLTVFYQGNIYSQMIDTLHHLLSENSPQSNININRVIYNLLLERVQHLQLNQSEGLSDKFSIFSLTNKNNESIIHTSKYIHPNRSAKLKNMLDEYYSLPLDNLKQKYEKMFSQCSSNYEIVLELAIIEIIIDTKKKLKYQFTKTHENKITQSYCFRY